MFQNPDLNRALHAFRDLADEPRRDQEAWYADQGMSPQHEEPYWRDLIFGQAKMDREWARRRLVELRIVDTADEAAEVERLALAEGR